MEIVTNQVHSDVRIASKKQMQTSSQEFCLNNKYIWLIHCWQWALINIDVIGSDYKFHFTLFILEEKLL